MMQLAITGATSGIGAEKAKALAPKCSRIFLLARNQEKAKNSSNPSTLQEVRRNSP